jgi:DNA-directed RNA polymerase subunit N (RpoN/RPB10)
MYRHEVGCLDGQGTGGVALKGKRRMAMAGRKDWVQADLRCLMCGRVIGRLVGPLPVDDGLRSVRVGRLPKFAAFRPTDVSVPTVRLVGGEHFRCSTCGGGVIMDELETFSTYEDIDDEDVEGRPRRGRPPKPWRRPTAEPNWLDELGIAG